MDVVLTPEERLELFGDFVPEDYEKEAEERWGDTDAYKQSMRRTKAYSKEDWLAIKQEGGAIESGLKAAFERGMTPDSAEAMDLAEAHRQQITKWFYDCSYEIHKGLSQMYVDDPRFKKHYEGIAPGLAEFVRDSAVANTALGRG